MDTKAHNDICFEQPHWKRIAQGFDIEKWFNDNQGIGTGGIRNPRRDYLTPTHRYYRFTSNMLPQANQLGSGWWITFDNFRTIKEFADRNQLEITYAARLFLAIPYEWSRMDRLISAVLTVPLDTYKGEGKVAEAEEGKWTPIQHIKVYQLYIPGLFKDKLYETSWKEVKIMYAHNQQTV